MRIALIRHPAPSIEPGICYGRLDVGLHACAEQHIAKLAADPDLRGFTNVWTSPAHRCSILARAIARALSVPLTTDPRLHELNFGTWEGERWDAIAPAELDRWAASPLLFAPPGGESGAALINRVGDFHAELVREGKDCVVVSHGGPLKVLIPLLLGTPVDLFVAPPPMASLRIVACRGNGDARYLTHRPAGGRAENHRTGLRGSGCNVALPTTVDQ